LVDLKRQLNALQALRCCFCRVSGFIQTDKEPLQQSLLIPICQR